MTQLIAALLAGFIMPGATVANVAPDEPAPIVQETATVQTITADDQGDLYVDHPDEPFTVETFNCGVRVTTSIDTYGYIYATPTGVIATTPEQEAVIDTYGNDFTVALNPAVAASWDYTVVVVVNGYSQNSNLAGTVTCN